MLEINITVIWKWKGFISHTIVLLTYTGVTEQDLKGPSWDRPSPHVLCLPLVCRKVAVSQNSPWVHKKPGSKINDWKWDWAGPCGAPATEAFLCSHFLSAEQTSASWPNTDPTGYWEQLMLQGWGGDAETRRTSLEVRLKGTREAHKDHLRPC